MGKHKYEKPKVLAKRKPKLKRPCDRTGEPVHVKDVLEWEDGTRLQVAALNYYGNGHWTAEDDCDGFSDNIEAGVIVWRGKGK